MNERENVSSTPEFADLESAVGASGHRILARIGSGGTSTVYKAVHLATNRTVAIKVIDAHHIDSMEKIASEAKLLSKLKHPGICQIYSFNQSPGGIIYFSMEWIEGVSLSEFVRRDGLSELTFEQIMRQMFEAVRYAHGEGVVHRDLKPDNVMIVGQEQQTEDGVKIKIIDFGLARALDGSERSVVHTQSLSGSPIYMSPEQCRQERGDERSDIYSLGVIMYEFICGATPFNGDTPMEVMYNHVNGTVPQLQTPNPKLTAFQPVIMRCLKKAAEQRYQSMSELIEAFEAARNHTTRVPRFSRRTLGFFLLLLCVTGVTIYRMKDYKLGKQPEAAMVAKSTKTFHPVSAKSQYIRAVDASIAPRERMKSLNGLLESADNQWKLLALCELIKVSDQPTERARLSKDLIKLVENTKSIDDDLAKHNVGRFHECCVFLADSHLLTEQRALLCALRNASFTKFDRQFNRETYRKLLRVYTKSNELHLVDQTRAQAFALINDEDAIIYTLLLYTEMAISAEYRRNYKESESYYSKATSVLLDENERTGWLDVLLPAASYFMRHGQIDRAEKLYAQAFETALAQDLSPRDSFRVHIEYARALCDAGIMLKNKRLLEKAVAQCDICLSNQNLSPYHIAEAASLRAQSFIALGQIPLAQASVGLAEKQYHGMFHSLAEANRRTNCYIQGMIELGSRQKERARRSFRDVVLAARALRVEAREPFLHHALEKALQVLQPQDVPAGLLEELKKALAVPADGFRF